MVSWAAVAASKAAIAVFFFAAAIVGAFVPYFVGKFSAGKGQLQHLNAFAGGEKRSGNSRERRDLG